MTLMKKAVLSAAVAAVMVTTAQARDQIRIVGSSTVYPFSSYVAEEFGATTGNPTPVVESTGSGGGMKLFCAGNGLDTPDFTNASRPMKTSEWELCQQNGVKNIIGVVIGFDGISIAQNKSNPDLDLTLEQIFLALAEEVPSKDGKSLIANPYKKWSDIDPSLPNREIKIIGAPTTSGTRDAFDEMVMQVASKKFDAYGSQKGKYKKVRTDGVFIPGGENDNLIVQRLEQDDAALGYFGYSFLEENSDKISGVKLLGIEPTFDNIATGKYPVSRSLYFYAKADHFKEVKGMEEYLDLFMDDMMIGTDGVLRTIGLIPMPANELQKAQSAVKTRTPLTAEMVKKGLVY